MLDLGPSQMYDPLLANLMQLDPFGAPAMIPLPQRQPSQGAQLAQSLLRQRAGLGITPQDQLIQQFLAQRGGAATAAPMPMGGTGSF